MEAPKIAGNQAKTGNTVLICSKLAFAIKLNNPLDPAEKITIRGLNSAPRGTNDQPIVLPYITTEIDADFWTAWEGSHGLKSRKPFPALKSGALWLAENADEANGIARENEKRTTGLQAMNGDRDSRMGSDGSKVQKEKED